MNMPDAIPFPPGEIRFECFEINMVPGVKGAMEFRILLPDDGTDGTKDYGDGRRSATHIVGMGTLYGPSARRTAKLLRRGKVGVTIVGKGGLERLPPK